MSLDREAILLQGQIRQGLGAALAGAVPGPAVARTRRLSAKTAGRVEALDDFVVGAFGDIE